MSAMLPAVYTSVASPEWDWMWDVDRLKALTAHNDCHLFIPWYCWYEDGEYSDFFPSKLQVGMCHDFNPNDSHIIEVDTRIAWCREDTSHFGVIDERGKAIWHIYRDPRVLSVCGPRNRWVPCCLTDMRFLKPDAVNNDKLTMKKLLQLKEICDASYTRKH